MIVVHALPVGIGRDAEVGAARVEGGQHVGHLPLAVDALAVERVAHARRVPRRAAVVQAAEALVEVVLVGMAATLVQERDVVAALDAWEGDRAATGNHHLGGSRVDPARDVPERRIAAAETGQDIRLLRAKACLEWPINVLIHEERVARPSVDAADARTSHVAEQRCGARVRCAAERATVTFAAATGLAPPSGWLSAGLRLRELRSSENGEDGARDRNRATVHLGRPRSARAGAPTGFCLWAAKTDQGVQHPPQCTQKGHASKEKIER